MQVEFLPPRWREEQQQLRQLPRHIFPLAYGKLIPGATEGRGPLHSPGPWPKENSGRGSASESHNPHLRVHSRE